MPAKPRDPFWRLRRALGATRKRAATVYDRARERRSAQEAIRDDGDG